MPRKQRLPKPRVDLPLSPAWKYWLMVGTFSPGRVPGWVALAQAHGGGSGDRLWAVHGAALEAEAIAHSFVPYWPRRRRPSGAGFRQWCEAFLAEHGY